MRNIVLQRIKLAGDLSNIGTDRPPWNKASYELKSWNWILQMDPTMFTFQAIQHIIEIIVVLLYKWKIKKSNKKEM